MILPDGSGADTGRPGASRAGLFAAAGLVVVAGFVLMGILSPAQPVAVEETTTTSTSIADLVPPFDTETFAVSEIARGEPFAWQPVMILDDSYPMALFDHEGWIYLFSTERPNFSGYEQGGLRGWRSGDGESWEPLGQVIPARHRISQIVSTPQGLVALEQTDEAGFAVWRSAFGFDWTVEELSVEGLGPSETVAPQAAGGSESVLVVAGNRYVDVQRRIREGFGPLGASDDIGFSYGWAVDIRGEEVEFQLYGPLGLSLGVLTPEDIDLTEAEVETLVDEWNGRNPGAEVWTRIGEGPWQETEIPGASYVEAIVTAPHGELTAVGYGSSGPTHWSSDDGLNWERADRFPRPYGLDNWRGTLVGPSEGGRASVLISGDNGDWEEIGPHDHFPIEFSWHIGPVGAGSGGIAALVTSWDRYRFEPEEPLEPVTLRSGDATLTIDFQSGSYNLETSDGATHTWQMHGTTTPEGITVDLASPVIEFHDPDTGEFLATFTIEQLMEAETSYWSGHHQPAAHRAVVFTSDGDEWSIQDGAVLGNDLEIMHIEVSETHVVAAGINPAGLYDPSLSPGFELWSAPIP